MQIGIYNETDPLKTAVTWGPIGAEAVLAQFYPPQISLFLDDMNVLKAREEAIEFAKLLRTKDVSIFHARDILAQNLKPTALNFDNVLKILIQKADDIREEFSTSNHTYYKEEIEELLKLDINRYGESKALTLNWELSLYPLLPLGNLIYARDQMNVLLSKRVKSIMKKRIRRPEVELYEAVYETIFSQTNNALTLPDGETFEGGDAYIHDGTIYIGVGSRTSIGAAKHIYKELKDQIKELSFKFVIVLDPNANKRSQRDQMLFMHLDTFSNPVGKRQIAVCLSEAKKRIVKEISEKNGKIVELDLRKSFLDYLFEDGQVIVSIPEEEQQTFGCNFLAVDNKTILVPLKTNKKTVEGLESIGKNVIYVPLDESTKGFGAAHCMTGQLLRKRLTGKTS